MSATNGDLPRARLVIVGGGVIGLSCAYHLSRAGVTDLVLLERETLGSGSTSRAAGGVRAQFSDEVNIRLGARSLETFRNFSVEFGQEIDYHEVGYLFLLSTAASVAAFESSIELQNRLGVPSRLISVDEAIGRSRFVSPEGLQAAAYSPTDGYCTPDSVVLGLASAVRRLGVRLLTGTQVTGIELSGGRIVSVVTDAGRIATDTVICAAGAWSAEVGNWVGVDLPVTPIRRQVLATEPVPGLDPAMPFTIDFETSFYFHRSGPGLVLGMSDPDESPGFDTSRSDDWLPKLGEIISVRAPGLQSVGISSGWAGLYEVTPDHNAVIGEAAAVSRFLYATGFSGHGFLMGPAVGEVMRDLYLGRPPVVDVTALDVERFQSTGGRPEMNIV